MELTQLNSTDSIQARFAHWVRRTPTAIAVRCGAEQLTYSELDQQSDVVARAVCRHGVKRGDFVALTLDRRPGLVAAILGILKAGAAYVPIDPAQPMHRQAFIRNDARPAAIVTEKKYERQCDGYTGAVLCIDALPTDDTAGPILTPANVGGSDLAYVIYTSGSTGNPKGVMVEHRQVVRLFDTSAPLFGFSPSDVWTLFHSYAFDFSVWEIWGALFYGGTLIVVPFELARAPRDFAALLIEQDVTVLNQTPSAFSNLMPEILARGTAGRLRQVVFGGEALDPRRLAPWFTRFGDQQPAVVNMYGITETTVHVTYKKLSQQDARDGLNDIGAALPDLRLYVLNERLRRVPLGAVGELYVSGAGVTLGYWNQPQLTAQRFIANPFAPSETLYKTGDLARRTDSGALEYVGRSDSQVKLRGFRIELGEIEKHLRSHPSVRDAVVALKGAGDERRLAAYVVLSNEATDRWKAELLKHLRATLPDYMIPSYAVVVGTLPLTENGKVGTELLPVPSGEDVWLERYVAPRNEVESALCGLFAQVLAVPRVGIEDNFFSLGGDSLKTVNLTAAAKAAGLEITIDQIFSHPCVADLAAVAAHSAGAAAVGTGPFDLISEADRLGLPEDVESAYPMSVMQQAMVYHNLSSVDNLFYHNVLHQRYRGHVDFGRMQRALESLMAAHDVLRTSFHITGYSEPLQLVHRQVPVPLRIRDIRALDSEAQATLLAQELARLRRERFVLTAAPLFQANIYRVSDQEFELIWLEHHAVLDGWSLASFMTQLMARYVQLGQSASIDDSIPRGYYRELIGAERNAIARPEEAQFWQLYLEGASYTRMQAGSRERAPGVPGGGMIDIPVDRLSACRALAARIGVPLKSVFLAAYIRVVSKLSNELDVLVGITTHGRPDDRPSTDLLGLYVSTHPLRVDCSGLTWRELIDRCWQAETQIWPHRFYPLAQIKQQRGGDELFETTFTYNNFSITEQASDIGVQPLRERTAFELDEMGVGVGFMVSGIGAGAYPPRCQLSVSYNAEQFDAAFGRKVERYLVAALTRIESDLDGVADVIDPADAALIRALDREPLAIPPEDTLVSEFARLVSRYPQNLAAEHGNTRISYAQLDAQSDVLAARLAVLGVEPGAPVGFDCSPCIEMLVGILAVLKRGGAFVALDPQQPPERLGIIVAEAGLRHVLCSRASRLQQMPGGAAVHAIESLLAGAGGRTGEASLSAPSISAESLAYVIYTSGSTGTPNGVAVRHGNALSFLRASQRRYGIGVGERVLQFSNTGFDIFIEELIASVFSGGTLVMTERSEILDPTRFWRFVHSRRISFASLPTSFWSLLCIEIGRLRRRWRPRAFRTCVVGGEAMQIERAREWLGHFGQDILLWNSFGPAEATSIVSVFDVRRLEEPGRAYKQVPVGLPLENSSCHVLGKDRLPVPVGVVGELHIGGTGVAWGYFNRPERTRERFVEWPLPGSDVRRHYRTGDLVRIREDGELEFIARVDAQIKIRGFRVEPEEVRHVIGTEVGVRQCVVVPRELDDPTAGGGPRLASGKQLVAYVVLQPGTDRGRIAHIAANVRQRLPDYLRPSAWVVLERLPLNVNGKVDLRALPQPEPDTPDTEGLEPRTPTETRLQGLWQEVLGVEQVSVDADFFAIGGHSLLLTRLLLQISEVFEVDLSIAELMRQRTIIDMASLIDAVQSVNTAPAAAADLQDEVEW